MSCARSGREWIAYQRFVASVIEPAGDRLHNTRESIRIWRDFRRHPPSVPQFDSICASIVIHDARQITNTLACLKSISTSRAGMSFEVIVVGDPANKLMIRTLGQIAGLRVATMPNKSGFARACNAGAALANGEYLVFLSSEARATDGWLMQLAETFRDLPGVGLAVPKTIDASGRLRISGGYSHPSASKYWKPDDPNHSRHNFVRELERCPLTCMMIPRQLFIQIEGFGNDRNDESDVWDAPAHGRADYQVVYQPWARIIHDEGRTAGQTPKQSISKRPPLNPPHVTANSRIAANRRLTAKSSQDR